MADRTYVVQVRPVDKAALGKVNPPPVMALLTAVNLMFYENYEAPEVQRYLEARQTGKWVYSRHGDVTLMTALFIDMAKIGAPSEAKQAVARSAGRFRKVKAAMSEVLKRSHCLPPLLQAA